MFFPCAVRTHQVMMSLVMAGTALAFHAAVAIAEEDPLWAEKMFEVKAIKFGSVAKNADTVVPVRVKNIYLENIEITNVATACGCVSWDETRKSPSPFPIVVPSGKTQVLNLRLDTNRYDGQRNSKVSVTLFDRVHSGSLYQTRVVEIPIEGYIRRDIVVQPGTVNFDAVDQGSGSERKVDIGYAGRPDWKLSSPKVSNQHLNVSLKETFRGGGRVNYELSVSLKSDAPVGFLRDQVTVLTDDANSPQISIPVEAKIEPDIIVTDVQFGALRPGEAKSIPVIVRSKKPFKIEMLYRKDNGINTFAKAFEVFETFKDKNLPLQSIPIRFVAPDAPGVFEEEFFLQISDHPQQISFKARGRVTGSPAGTGQR